MNRSSRFRCYPTKETCVSCKVHRRSHGPPRPPNMKTRNYMVPAMIGRYRNTGTRLHDRRMPRGGNRNVQAELMVDADGELEFIYDRCYDGLVEPIMIGNEKN